MPLRGPPVDKKGLRCSPCPFVAQKRRSSQPFVDRPHSDLAILSLANCQRALETQNSSEFAHWIWLSSSQKTKNSKPKTHRPAASTFAFKPSADRDRSGQRRRRILSCPYRGGGIVRGSVKWKNTLAYPKGDSTACQPATNPRDCIQSSRFKTPQETFHVQSSGYRSGTHGQHIRR